MGVYIATFRLTGISPLLMNNPIAMGKTNPDGLRAKKHPSAAEEAESKLYKNDDGKLFVPTMAIRASLLGACTNRKVGKLNAKQVISAAVFTTGLESILVDPKTRKPITTYKVNTARAVVMRAGILRSRPEISPWSCDVDFEVDDEYLSEPNTINQLLNIAGKIRGLLDWRPEKKGPYGRYTSELVSSGKVSMPSNDKPASKRKAA